MLVLGIDLETTGLDTANDHITEIGAVLWDTDRKKPLVLFNNLLKVPVKLEPRITELTGLTDADLETYGMEPAAVLTYFLGVFSLAEVIVAHNGNLFDRPMFESNCKRHGVVFPKRLWVDTTTDIEFPTTITTRKLVHLAAEHKFVNPFAHRAVFDVCTMLTVASAYDWKQIMRYAHSPTLVVQADVLYQTREEAKKRNYRFDGVTKTWRKSIKEFQLEEEQKASPFKVIVLSKGVVS